MGSGAYEKIKPRKAAIILTLMCTPLLTSKAKNSVLHIPSNTVYKSITQAAKHFGFRRGTLAKRISSGEELEFQLLNVKN